MPETLYRVRSGGVAARSSWARCRPSSPRRSTCREDRRGDGDATGCAWAVQGSLVEPESASAYSQHLRSLGLGDGVGWVGFEKVLEAPEERGRGQPELGSMSSAGPPPWRYHRRSKSTISTASVLGMIVAFHRSVRCADMRRCWRKLCSVAHTGAGPCLQSTYGDHRGSL